MISIKIIVNEILEKAIIEYPLLKKCKSNMIDAFEILNQCYSKGGKLLVCGNGGSAADCEHIVGELMKSFLLKRKISTKDIKKIKNTFPKDWSYLSNNLQATLPAISLTSQTSLLTAIINDTYSDIIFAQQVYGYAKKHDVLLAISTSGNSKNVINAIKVAKALDVSVIGLTGESGGLMNDLCDITIKVPANETYKIQELHLPIYHTLCAMLEAEFFDE